ncbi:MAG: hypothetical protein RMJ36_02730 [Candidatus Calescibacterium sp.]|nr:hypothetical protein [Candidatus Calescibacterium sp.]MDW8132555.1 hypothetical protein [Candidatus Calescibacterium sp.]
MILLENIFEYKTLSKIKSLIEFIETLNCESIEWGFVGGIPRDLYFYKKKLKTNEIDIIFFEPVEKIFLIISEKFRELIKEKYFHQNFLTAKIVLKNGITLDLITARSEYYPYPASLPIVKNTSNITEDLIRRDITINTILFKRKTNHPDIMFEIIDLFGGYKDLINQVTRVLHKNSFIDDPTRIYRLLKYKVRLNLNIDPLTHELIKNSLKYINLLSINRVFNELKRINQEKKFDKIFEEFVNLKFDPINLLELESKQNIDNLIKDLKFLRKSIISFEKFFNNQKNKIKINYDKNKVIFSFLIAKNFIVNNKYNHVISQNVHKLSEIWKIVLDEEKKEIKPKYLKRLSIDLYYKHKEVDIFILLIFLLFKTNSLHLKFILKKVFKKLFINQLKINPPFIKSIAKYYFNKDLKLEKIKEITKIINKMYIFNKIRTINQAIRFIKKIIKRELDNNIEIDK